MNDGVMSQKLELSPNHMEMVNDSLVNGITTEQSQKSPHFFA